VARRSAAPAARGTPGLEGARIAQQRFGHAVGRQRQHQQRHRIERAVVVRVIVRVSRVVRVAMLLVVRMRAGVQQVFARLERVDAEPLVRPHRLEEGRVHGERALEVEGAEAQHLLQWHRRALGTQDLRGTVDRAQLARQPRQRRLVDDRSC
jgi:hypothetical protein